MADDLDVKEGRRSCQARIRAAWPAPGTHCCSCRAVEMGSLDADSSRVDTHIVSLISDGNVSDAVGTSSSPTQHTVYESKVIRGSPCGLPCRCVAAAEGHPDTTRGFRLTDSSRALSILLKPGACTLTSIPLLPVCLSLPLISCANPELALCWCRPDLTFYDKTATTTRRPSFQDLQVKLQNVRFALCCFPDD